MPRLAWLTDAHLNFVTETEIAQLTAAIRTEQPSALLVGGDLGEADSWENYLRQLEGALQLPIYFVLGNHDFYGGSIAEIRRRAEQLSQSSQWLKWLPAINLVELDERTALVGHGGWGDARAKSFRQSRVLLNDYFLIRELRAAAAIPDGVETWWGDPSAILNAGLESQLQDLGQEAAEHFRRVLPEALLTHEQVIVLMHVPPFREACWHAGKISDDDWAPHFCCIAAGEALVEVMQQHPQKRMTVLCGHTHGKGTAQILPNLIVHTGEAEYGQPAIQCIIETDDLN